MSWVDQFEDSGVGAGDEQFAGGVVHRDRVRLATVAIRVTTCGVAPVRRPCRGMGRRWPRRARLALLQIVAVATCAHQVDRR